MKLFIGLFIFLTTSMSPLPEEHTLVHECKPKKEISCVVDTSFVCPPGYIDGCITNETRKHECIRVEDETAPSCAIDMKLECPDNFEDGCLTQETESHVCVPSRGPLCIKGMKLSCPSGFEDSCS